MAPKKKLKGPAATRALIQDIKDNPQLRQNILNAPDKVYLYDKNSPSVKQRRARYITEFINIMRGLHAVPESITDDQIRRTYLKPDVVIKHAVQYINAVASSSHHAGNIQEKMKTSTLRQRVEAIWWWAGWEAGADALTVWTQWSRDIPAAIHKAANEHDLGTGKWEKHYFAVPELRLLFSTVVNRTRYVDWYKQMYVAWVLSYITGARPGTLGESQGYIGQDQALFWKDITFFRHVDKPGIFLRVRYRFLRGQRDPHHEKSSALNGAEFLIMPCRTPENLVADLTWLLLLLAHERGLFGDQQIDDLMKSDGSELTHVPSVSNEPVFVQLKGPNTTELNRRKPMLAGSFNLPLQRSAKLAGLAVRVTMYVFRREFITTAGRNLSVEEAKTLATHRSAQLGSYGRYDFGTGDLDVAAVTLGEVEGLSDIAKQRNARRQRLTSAAINKQQDFPFEQRSVYVKDNLVNDDTAIAFEDALTSILSTIRADFALETKSIQATLVALSSTSNVATLETGAYPVDTGTSMSEGSGTAVPVLAGVPSTSAPTGEPAKITKWVPPGDMDTSNPLAWSGMATDICRTDKANAGHFLAAFMLTRKVARNYLIRCYHTAFDAMWQQSVKKPSLAQIQERSREVSMLPTLLPRPSLTSVRSSKELDAVNPQREETIIRNMQEQERDPDAGELNADVDETLATTVAIVRADPWRGQVSNDVEADAEDDAADELDSNLTDPVLLALTQSKSGIMAVNMPGEEDEVDVQMGLDIPSTSDIGADVANDLYHQARGQLVKFWTDTIEVPRGKQSCGICKASVDGDISPAFLLNGVNKGGEYKSAYKYGRHLQGNIHDPDTHQFRLWTHDRATDALGNYKCPLAGCPDFKKYYRLNKFEEHIKERHAAFYDRLAH